MNFILAWICIPEKMENFELFLTGAHKVLTEISSGWLARET